MPTSKSTTPSKQTAARKRAAGAKAKQSTATEAGEGGEESGGSAKEHAEITASSAVVTASIPDAVMVSVITDALDDASSNELNEPVNTVTPVESAQETMTIPLLSVMDSSAQPPIANAQPIAQSLTSPPDSQASRLGPAIDIITGTIGGIGKTQFAHLLVGYYFNRMLRSGVLQPIHLVEGDHRGVKFHKTYQSLPAPFTTMVAGLHQTILSDDPSKQSNADFVVQVALESNTPVVINTPANSAEAMASWLLERDIPTLCEEAGVLLRYWFVCRNTPDSLNAFIDSLSSLQTMVPHILVKNQFSGQLGHKGDWALPEVLAKAINDVNLPVVTMPSLYIQNQMFSERFNIPFEVARAYDPEAFSLSYWQHRLSVDDLLITRWIEWTGGTVEMFLKQWCEYWEAAGLLYTGNSSAEKHQFMAQYDIPLPSVGRNQLNKFLSAGYSSIAAMGI